MPKTFTPEELKLYFFGNIKHVAYQETLNRYNDLYQHSVGEIPKTLISDRRPRESDDIKNYRAKIYVPKTKSPITKVLNSLAKIRRSADWSIDFDKSFNPSNVTEEESLHAYCEENYPGFESLTNWMFSIGLKNMGVDPNAVIAVFPNNPEIAENEFYKPVAMLFNSPEVYYFEEGQGAAILLSMEKNTIAINTQAQQYFYGNVFYVFTEIEFTRYEQQMDNSYIPTQYIKHNLGKLPVFKIPAVFLKQMDNTLIQETRLAPMVPHLDEAAREYSDLQAAKVQHMHPLMWYYDNKSCNHCGGSGKVINQNDISSGPQSCKTCNGKGKINFSPFANIAVDPPKLGESAVPAPPAGYIGRDTEIIKLQDASVANNLFMALSSINMQFLDQTPLNISGEAKQVDREELNNFVYSFAEDIVRCMDKIYYWICEWRYSFAVPDKNKRKEMLPKIIVPQNFDLLPTDYLIEEITKASQTKKVNALLIYALEREYAVKKFYNNPEIASFTSALFELDPLPGLSDDDKMIRVSNKGVSQEDYVISCNLISFVKRAADKEKDFFDKSYEDKMKIIKQFAVDKIKDISGSSAIVQQAAPPPAPVIPPTGN